MKKITLFMMALMMTIGAMAQFPMEQRIMQNNDAHVAFKYDGIIKASAYVNNTKTASVVISAITTVGDNVTFTATPNADCASYTILVAPTGAVESYATSQSTTVEAVIAANGDPYTGVQTLTYQGLDPNGVAYTVYVLATANDQTTAVSTTNFTSAMTGGTGTANVVFTVTNVTQTTVDLSFTINDQTSYYYYIVAPVDTLALYGYNTTDDIRTLLETNGTKTFSDLAGTVGGTNPLTNNTEYIVCAFPYNQTNTLGTYTAPIHFTTGQSGLNDVATISTSVYPNPAKDVVNLTSSSKMNRVEMFNIMGQKVSEKSVNTNSTSVNVANLNAGTYVVKVYTNAGVSTKKIVVE